MKFAHWDGASWVIEVVETGTPGFGAYASLAYDPVSGNPAIAHISYDEGCVRFVRSDGSAWGGAAIVDCGASQAVSWSSLEFDSDGTPYIGYVRQNALKVAEFDGDDWRIESIDVGSLGGVSLALDPVSELPTVSYADFAGNHDDIKYAKRLP